MQLIDDLFAGFDPAQVAAARASVLAEASDQGTARAMSRTHRLHMRRAKAEATLADILPPRLAAGESWHVISRGDIDALSYLRHILAGVPYLDHVAMSTWCIARADLEEIDAWLDTGRIERFDLYAGEIFPNQYGDEFELASRMSATYGGKLVIARNHSKVTLCALAEEAYRVVIESSANVNTNPRIEQSALHCSSELHAFYLEFFDGLHSIQRA